MSASGIEFDETGERFRVKSTIGVDVNNDEWLIHSHPTRSSASGADFEDRFGADLNNLRELGNRIGSLVIEPNGKVVILRTPLRIASVVIQQPEAPVWRYATYIFDRFGTEDVRISEIKTTEVIEAMPLGIERIRELQEGIPRLYTTFEIGALGPPLKAERPAEAEAELTASAKQLVEDIARRDRRLLEGVAKISAQKGMSELQIAERIALLLKQAGIYQGHLGVVIDARSGAFDIQEITTTIRNSSSGESSPVKYFVVVDEDRTGKIITTTNMHIIGASQGDSLLTKLSAMMREKGIDIKPSNTAIAIPEARSDLVEEQYTAADNNVDAMSSFLIANKDAVKGEETHIPAATLISATARLSASGKTIVMPVGNMRPETEAMFERLQKMLRGVLRLIRVAKFEIDRIFREYITALSETARSL